MRRWFIDCGAHRGESVQMAVRLYPGIFPIAVEPNAACWDDLHTEGALVVPAAVWTSFGYRDLYVGEHEVSSTLISEKTTGGISPERTTRTPTVTLSSLIDPIPPTDAIVLKLDIEGAEYDVLEQALKDGELDRVEDLFVDFHSDRIAGFPVERHNTLVQRLRAKGFSLHKWNPNTGLIKTKNWIR